MKTYVTQSDFMDAFRSSNTYKNNFTYDGLKALYDYLEEYEDSTGEELEFDMVALCCEYTQYDSLEELQQNYNDIETMEDLENNTIVIRIPDQESFIIQDY